jgi:DNA polymerase-3 subunit beta
MDVTLSQENLARLVSQVQGVMEDRSQAQVGLRAEGSVLTISMVTKSMSAYSQTTCDVKQEGMVFTAAKLFIDIARELPRGLVTLKTQDASLAITANASKELLIKIPLFSEASWREKPNFTDALQAEIPCQKMAYMIEQVQFCISQECPRNYGTVGFLHQVQEKTLRLVGSDGFRLSYCDVQCEVASEFLAKGICIPKRSLIELYRMCQEGSETIQLAISSDQQMMSAKIEGAEFFFLLSTIKYPNYKGVIPQAHPHQVNVSRNMIQNVAKRVLLAADKNRSLLLDFSEVGVFVSSRNLGSTEGRESIPVEDYQGPRCSISVNGKYLTEILNTALCEQVDLKFEDNDKPIVIVPNKEPQACYSQHVLVPLREGH